MEAGFWESFFRDLTGPGRLRLVLQPLMAVVIGMQQGRSDRQAGLAPFVLRLVGMRGRWALLAESVRELVLPLSLAVVVDGVLQVVTAGRLRLLEALVAGGVLVYVPYAVARALTNRLGALRGRRAREV